MGGGGHVRVAIAHDYLTQRGGAERVVLAMARAFPDAPIYTSLYDPQETFPEFADLDVRPSRLNRVRYLRRHHRAALPFLPRAVSAMTIDADVVLVSSSGWAHGVTSTGEKLVYCYSPARWLHQQRRYLGDHPSRGTAFALRMLSPWLRRWDLRAAHSASDYVTVSSVVQDRVHSVYGLPSVVVPAPNPTPTCARPSRWRRRELARRRGFGSASRGCCHTRTPTRSSRHPQDEPRRRLIIVGSGPKKVGFAASGGNVLFLEGISDGRWPGCTAARGR